MKTIRRCFRDARCQKSVYAKINRNPLIPMHNVDTRCVTFVQKLIPTGTSISEM